MSTSEGLRIEGLAKRYGEADATLDKETQSLAVRVVSAYMEVLLADDQVGLMQAQIEATTTQLKAAGVRVERGDGVAALRQRTGRKRRQRLRHQSGHRHGAAVG